QARDLFCEARCTLFEEIDDDRVEERSHHTTCDELPSLRILDSLAHQVDARSCSNAATDDSCVRLHRCRQETKTLGGCSSICLCIYFWECFRSHLLGNQKILQEAGEELVRDHTRGDEATGLNPLHDHTRRISTKAARNSIPSATTSTNRCSTRGCPTNRPTTIAHSPTTIPTNRPTTIAHYPTTTHRALSSTIANYPATTHGALPLADDSTCIANNATCLPTTHGAPLCGSRLPTTVCCQFAETARCSTRTPTTTIFCHNGYSFSFLEPLRGSESDATFPAATCLGHCEGNRWSLGVPPRATI